MKEIKKYPVILFFGALLYVLSIADLFSPLEYFSDLENRKLEVFPKFSLKMLIENEYTPKVEDFTEDHFIVRNSWISLKSISEGILGKTENNAIVYGEDGRMFTKYLKTDLENQNKNIDAINSFIQRHEKENITVMLAPTNSDFSKEYRSEYAPVLDSSAIIANAKGQIKNGRFLDLQESFSTHSTQEYLYYRTDHHWTYLGAYWAYDAYMKHVNKTPKKLEDFKFVEVENFLGTHYSKAKSFNAIPDTFSYPESDATIDILGNKQGIYDLSKLDTRDKYAMLLHGNNSISTVNGKGDGKILVIKDSYANSFVPYLAQSYNKIDVLDMRFYSQSVDKLVADNQYDEILFLYNCETFDSDIYLPKINMYK